jgi:DNA helicase TIP49 (TBP-interacting protein)
MLIFNKINDAYIINMKIKGNFLRVLEASKKELLQTCVRQAVIVLVPEALAKVSGMTLVVEYINNNANAKKFQQSLSEEIQIALEALETTKTTYRNLQRLCNSEPLASAILTDAIANLEQAKALVTLSFELMQ